MSYLRFPPPVGQSPYAEHYWMVRGSSTRREILIPNGRPARITHVEIAALDVERATAFYAQAFGWRTERSPISTPPSRQYAVQAVRR